jgi:radical SAM superfamily enzyme YgiQ (UPF0313 family)
MPRIVLATLNARWTHAAFGLRCLRANLGELQPDSAIREFDIAARPADVVEALLADSPTIVGLGVYIWNVELATKVVTDLKRVAPHVLVVLGGPEVSHEADQQPIVDAADYTICGEADVAFRTLCRQLLAGEKPADKIIRPPAPPFDQLVLPYDEYTDEDIAHRVIYVEASRGCPFSCEFCLSSLDETVRNATLEHFLAAMQRLLDRGLRQFKFIDRTFNLNLNISSEILRFFLERHTPGLFVHFEMIPDRLPEKLREVIAQFPPGALQFEVGIQTFNEEVAARISRRQDNEKAAQNLRWLREHTGVHVHADLIVGLPGETLASFAAGFDRLVRLGPQEIQVGMLKRLRGTPIARHDEPFTMRYSAHAPYEVLSTGVIDFPTIQRMRRFARFWDIVANSGKFARTLPWIWAGEGDSPFERFAALSDWLWQRTGRTHAIALHRLAELLWQWLTTENHRPPAEVARALAADIADGGRRDVPEYLREYVAHEQMQTTGRTEALPKRQQRHLAADNLQ